ncbi:hypothetical protein IC607_11815 [Cellulomonas sp. JH27-2]|uniref:hypothetical protein n=1 Tax=Cellulomonas sp. JH27-2 TaxID=2774139 RepID=UPI00177BD8A9|nr:hypothetical protein [Cellulomonas sp. JH27-2]MBD8059651.1 hypothetical protein [Cellulomonas sp. JH27-2]
MVLDPARAPRRSDLPWLRRRPLPRPTTPTSPTSTTSTTSAAAGATTGGPARAHSIDLRHPGRPAPGSSARPAGVQPVAARPSAEPPPPGPAQRPPAATSLDLSSSSSTSLDLSGSTTTGGGSDSTSLDLSSSGSTSLDLSSGSTSLDLSPGGGSAGGSSGAAPGTPQPRAARRRRAAADGDAVLGYEPERVVVGRPTLLSRENPTVALTRVQSGVGVLRITARVSRTIGDLRLAAFCALTTPDTSADPTAVDVTLLDHNRGMTVAPTGSRRPVVQALDQGFLVDLRQVTRVRRLVVLAFSPTASALAWSGALRVETIGGARVDVPLEHEQGAGSLVALSVVDVAGELVLRAERDLVPGALREAGAAYGFDTLTWVDKWTPLT